MQIFRRVLSLNTVSVGLAIALTASLMPCGSISSWAGPDNKPQQIPCHVFETPATKDSPARSIRIVGAEEGDPAVVQVVSMMKDMLKSANAKDIDGVLKHYSPRFVSGDNLSLAQIRSLLEETWGAYPDIKYDTEVVEIRLNGNWATVESKDMTKATTQPGTVLPDVNGSMESQSRGLLFLHRVSKSWEIVSDSTLYEKAVIHYGPTQGLNLTLSAPDQVFAGQTYTAKISADLPKENFAIAHIAKEPLIFPSPKSKEKFRSITPEQGALERVFSANTTNHNELVTVTMGLTQVTSGSSPMDRPKVQLKGVATLVKRVNVVSKVPEAFKTMDSVDGLVRVSADGTEDFRQKAGEPTPDDDE